MHGTQAAAFRYPRPLRFLHWLVAGLVLVIWPVGFILDRLKGEVKTFGYLVHESLGFLVLWLMLCRLGVRLTSGVERPRTTSPFDGAARAVHILFYCALIVAPVTGFLATNAFGFPLQWFGVVPVWSPVAKHEALARPLMAVHLAAVWTLAVLVVLHVCAALYHAVVRRDGTFQRMV